MTKPAAHSNIVRYSLSSSARPVETKPAAQSNNVLMKSRQVSRALTLHHFGARCNAALPSGSLYYVRSTPRRVLQSSGPSNPRAWRPARLTQLYTPTHSLPNHLKLGINGLSSIPCSRVLICAISISFGVSAAGKCRSAAMRCSSCMLCCSGYFSSNSDRAAVTFDCGLGACRGDDFPTTPPPPRSSASTAGIDSNLDEQCSDADDDCCRL